MSSVLTRSRDSKERPRDPTLQNSHSDLIVSSTAPDWTRERPRRFWDPSRRLLKSIRDYRNAGARARPWAGLLRKYCALRHRFWTVVTGAEIDVNAVMGGGLLIPPPNGIVIHPQAVIGPNCLIFQQVTVGTTARGGTPRIGGHVDIGAGARILGGITVGDHAVIGANAVVLEDVPSHGRAVGVPAVVSVRPSVLAAP